MEERIRKLEQDIMKLKAAYDQYFAGIERRSPDQLADRVAKEVRTLTSTVMTNTALRFRAQQAISRYNTYHQFWQRNLREIEEGRKPKRRITAAVSVPDEGNTSVYEISTGSENKQDMDKLFSALTQEYKRVGTGKSPDMEKVRNALEQQTRTIRDKYGSDKVTFKITTEGGKVTIKAGPADRRKS
jgi:hypothetical protein